MKDARLFDLVEYHRDYVRKVFVKVQTHLYNKPRAICVGEKNKIIFHTPPSRMTRFAIIPNGITQYSNQFKDKRVGKSVHKPVL